MLGAVHLNRRRWGTAGAVLLAAIGGSVRAAEQQPDPPGDPGLLILHQADVYLEFEGEYTHQRVRTDSRRFLRPDFEQTNESWDFEERIGLTLGGTLVDPRFISFAGDFSFALTQSRFEEDGLGYDITDKDNGYLIHYDARLNFFEGRKFSGSVYALRDENRINRRFQPTLNEDRQGYGTSWVFGDERLPMELSYDYQEVDRTGNFDPRDDEHYTDSRLYYGVEWLIDQGHSLKFSYERADTKQEYQGLRDAFETDRNLVILDHELAFGSQDQHLLRTLVHWQEESGDFARDLFEIGPQLILQHSETLQTQYKYQFNREEYGGLNIDTHRADVQLNHQLYSNLFSTYDVFVLYEDVEGEVETTQYGAFADWQYNRRNRFGHFYANLHLAYDTEDIDGDDGERLVLNESGTFRDPQSIVLRNRNVVNASIVVSDAANRRFYRRGVDYAVVELGEYTALTRIPTGLIVNGETVLVDYEYRTPVDGQLDTTRVDLNVEQRFTNGWNPYYRLSYRNQEDDYSSEYGRRGDRTDHHRLGARYEQPRYAFDAEVEIYDDPVEPFDAFHLGGMVRLVKKTDQDLDFSARVSRYFFETDDYDGYYSWYERDGDRNVAVLDLDLDHRWRLTDRVSTVERVSYRYEQDSVAGDTREWDLTAAIEYVYGDLSGELALEYDKLELPDSDDEVFGIYLRVRREIPNVLARR